MCSQLNIYFIFFCRRRKPLNGGHGNGSPHEEHLIEDFDKSEVELDSFNKRGSFIGQSKMFDKFPYIDEDVGDTNDYNSNDDVFDVEKQERDWILSP